MSRYEYSIPTWERPVSRSHRRVHRRSTAPSASDLAEVFLQFNQMLAERMNEMVMDVLAPDVGRERGPRHKRHHRHWDDECYDPCYHDPCHCRCCIHDADLVVYTRVGERRIVPIEIENSRRREREIKLELSNWTTNSGKQVGVEGQFLTPTSFTLGPCDVHEAILVVNATGKTTQDDKEREKEPADRLPDVDDCLVVYADLRVEGCGIRPLRIAVALLPRDCDVYEINCRCSCC